MKYKVVWPNDSSAEYESAFTTWNGHVADCTVGMRWAMGKSYENAVEHIQNQGGQVALYLGSQDVMTLNQKFDGAYETPSTNEGIVKGIDVIGKPRTIQPGSKPWDVPDGCVRITRSGRSTENDD